jgi:meso-butanediol dehydrogenase/(S,S)-butanediol dehydrogenase/diacetyl reductase
LGRLQGKFALVTGASRGIGRAIAEAYASEGANLFLTATNLDKLNETRESCLVHDVTVACHTADIGQPEEVQSLFEAAHAWAQGEAGGLDVLVNNAGIYVGKPFTAYQLEEFDRMMRVNVYSVFRLMQLAISHMQERGGGKIINISSTAGKWESPNQAVYNATKHAVVGLTKCAALENAAAGINVNAICPGMVETDMFNEFEVHAEAAGITLDELKATTTGRIPMGRFLVPEEIAPIAVYLASGESDGMTGQTITISGGMRMG